MEGVGYALQNFPQPKAGSDEFFVAGKAALVEGPAVRAEILRDARHMADASETAFELWIDRVMHTRWENVLTPQMRSVQEVAGLGRFGRTELTSVLRRCQVIA